MMRQNAKIIGKLFKRLEKVDIASNHDVSIGSCLRIRALIDVSKSLLKDFSNRKENGSLERICFQYKRLSDMYFMCGPLDSGLPKCL